MWGTTHDHSFHYGNAIVIQELTPKGYEVPGSDRNNGNYMPSCKKSARWVGEKREPNLDESGRNHLQENELEGKNYMFAWAPHGIFGTIRLGSGGTLWNHLYPKTWGHWCSFGGAFYLPGFREFSFAAGAIDASKKTLDKIPADHCSLHIIPGGIREMSLTDYHSK